MKRLSTLLAFLILPLLLIAQGWPSNYKGVMLQGFYWDSYSDSQWSKLESESDELSQYFKLIWVPNSAYCNTTSNAMGYAPVYWYNHLSCFGNEAQLRSMISTFKAKGTGIIEDVVINHRNGVTNWTDFPAEVVDGKTWQLTTADICCTDEVNNQSDQQKATGAQDTGDDFNGCRDLDHTSQNVQNNVINYLNYLKNNLGYTGFRYDMVKGYGATYLSKYNQATTPEFSVGEYWDNYDNITNWLNGTKDVNGNIQSAAFDFALKSNITTAFNNSDWSVLTNRGIVGDPNYSRYSVTFVDNHDTYRDAATKVANNILAANAFILSLPGTPCVFLPHWQTYKQDIKQMILARQLAGINNQSTCSEVWKDNQNRLYAVKTTGENGSITLIVGNGTDIYDPSVSDNMHYLMSGNNYAIYISKNLESPWANIPSGTYETALNVMLTAISQTSGVKLVYTTDGTEPTASNGTQVDNGSNVNISSTTTLKVGLLNGSNVSNVITRNYEIKPFQATSITIYAKLPDTWTTKNIYAWTTNNGTDYPIAAWPGTSLTETTYIAGEKWYYKTFNKSSSDYNLKIIFNNGTGGTNNQTSNITDITSDKFYTVYFDNNNSLNYSDNTLNYNAQKENEENIEKVVATGDATSLLLGADCQSTIGWSNMDLKSDINNWNGTLEKVMQPLVTAQPFQILSNMPKGTYTVQAIVRGGDGESLQIAINDNTEIRTLSGMTDGAVSTVSNTGVADMTVTGTNNGWHKIQQSYSLANDGNITIGFKLLSGSSNWQIGGMKLLYNADNADATSYKTMASTDTKTTFVDVTGDNKFSFFERGVDKNCIVKAQVGTAPANLPCNAIIDGTCAKLQLSDGNYDFGTQETFTATTSSYDRKFDSTKSSTVYLPFALSATEVAAAGKFYAIAGYNSSTGEITFKKVNETAADIPYLFVPTSSTAPFTDLGEKEISVSTSASVAPEGTDISFKGVFSTQTLRSTDTETVYGYKSDGTFVQIGTENGVIIEPFRAYISLKKASAAKLKALFDDSTTGVTKISGNKTSNNNVYSIDGQLVSNKGLSIPLEKGVYIMAGKKLVIK